MKDLLSELMQARYRALGGAMDEAEKHIAEALELLNDAIGGCGGSIPSARARAVRGYLDEAYSATKRNDASRALAAIASALEMLRKVEIR